METVTVNQQVEKDLSTIERRENHLWLSAFVLCLVLVGFAIGSFYVAFEDVTAGDAPRRFLVTALMGISLLSLLFFLWVLVSRRSFKRIRRMFEAQAVRDALTGLLNRQSFAERAEHELARARRDQTLLGILLCDLDNFKSVNDTYGHPAGDRALQRVSKAVLSATRGSDLVFRWGGDELIVLLSPTARDGALAAASRIRSEVSAVKLDLGIGVDLSIGVALFPEHGRDIDDLIRLADKALYIAKRSGDKIHVGEEELPLDELAVRLVFQPVVESGSKNVIGYEVLSRDPTGGQSIGDLFRRYEAVGQLPDLKRLIFRRQVAEAERLGLERVFINADFELLAAVEPMEPPPHTEVVLDISEAEAGIGTASYFEVIDKWRRRGFKFAIDDFGAGFISLPFVAQLFPSFIKMDRSAILEAGGSERYSSFLRDMLAAMRNYSQEGIIAEGVETDEELDLVRRLGVDQVQGHLIGRPRELTEPPVPSERKRAKT